MSYWQVRERGIEGGIWKLTQKEKLTIGRNKDCHIVLASQSVDGSHAVVEWNIKQEAFIIQDLGTVNGTFLNNHPVRRGITTLCHGDLLRFGYEKSRLFRVEEIYLPSCSTHSQPTPSSSVTTQTSPQAPLTTAPSTSGDDIIASQSAAQHHVFQTTPQHVAQMTAVGGQSAQPQVVSSVQYIPMPGQQLMYSNVQSPLHVPYVVAQAPLHYGYPPPSPPISVSPHILVPSGPGPPPSPPVTTIPQVFMSLPNSPNPVIQSEAVTTPTNDQQHLHVEDVECESSEKALTRSDGRRSVELSNSPQLSSASKLYGEPSWWGEKDDKETSSSEFEFAKPGTQILRDLEPQTKALEEGGSSRGLRLSAKDELRMQAINNSIAQDKDPTSSWVIDFGGTGTKPKPTRPHRPRSADPSPSRSPSHRIRDVSPAARGNRRSISPAARRMTVSTSSAVSPGSSPIHRSATVVKKKEFDSTSMKKPPSGSLPRSKTIRGKPKVQRSDPRCRSLEGLKSGHKPSCDSPSGSHDHPAGDKTKSKAISDETYTLTQDTEECGKVTSEPSQERPSSARKQWGNEEPHQAPDSLMLASIEARIRRLSKMAHSVAIHVTSLKQSLLSVGVVTTQDHTSFEPFSTAGGSDQGMPEWKFFNKEVDSIFRSVRATERWLKDIDNTVNAIQPVGGVTPGKGVASEDVDHPSNEVESEGEYYQDSIDTLSYTSDETYVKCSDF